MSLRESISERGIPRRQFLKGAAVVAGAALTSLALGGGTYGKEMIDPAERTANDVLAVEGFRISINKYGLPFKIADPQGEETDFNLSRIRKEQEAAISAKEPRLLTAVRLEGKTLDMETKPVYTERHPEVSKLPTDVLTDRDLEKRGIKIIQADNTSLFIRQDAFIQDGPLAQFANGRRKLIVALLDFPVVTELAATDKKYDQVRHLLKKQTEDPRVLRAARIDKAKSNIDSSRAELKKVRNGQGNQAKDYLEFVETAVLTNQTDRFIREKLITDKEIVAEATIGKSEGSGQYFSPQNSGIENTAVIFICVGKLEGYAEYLQVYFDSEGKCKASNFADMKTFGDKTPKAYQTHPDPESFYTNVNPGVDQSGFYPYGSQTPGLITWHEFKHDILTTVKTPADVSEYETDMEAMKDIRKGDKRWVDSGFTDDSGYPFVFSLPNGNFILT